MFDFARSVVVGAEQDHGAGRVAPTRYAQSIRAGIELLRPGTRLSDLARRCEDVLAASAHARRHGVPAHTMSGFWGHGLGLGWEPPWIGPDDHQVVEQGMCLAVERRAAVEGLGGAQYEDNVIVGAAGPELLTHTP